jgi:hypothetical protein
LHYFRSQERAPLYMIDIVIQCTVLEYADATLWRQQTARGLLYAVEGGRKVVLERLGCVKRSNKHGLAHLGRSVEMCCGCRLLNAFWNSRLQRYDGYATSRSTLLLDIELSGATGRP